MSGLSFGKKVYRRRVELHLSQEELAKRLGINRCTVADYEHDRTTPRTPQLKLRLAETLGLDYDELYDNTLGAVALKPKMAVKIGLNFPQLRRSFKKTSGLQLRCWRRMFKYLLNCVDTLADEDREAIYACLEEMKKVCNERKILNRRVS